MNQDKILQSQVQQVPAHRWFWLKVVVVVAFFALLLRLFSMQVMNGATYRTKITNERVERFSISASRGKILDRNSIPLAESRPVYDLIYLPLEGQASANQIPLSETVRQLTGILGKSAKELLKQMDVGDHPQIAIAVIVPEGGHGSESSGPIARKIMDSYFREGKRE